MPQTPIKIDSFPDDQVLWVVCIPGSVRKNTSASSTNPLVKVALRKVLNEDNLHDESNLSQKFFIIDIALPELDIVRNGTLWKNKVRQESLWGGFVSETFCFDLTNKTIKSVNFFEATPENNNKKYVPDFKYKVPFNSHFDSKLTILETKDNVEILIPALELFTTTYTPMEKDIRRKLILNNHTTVINDYLKINKCRVLEDGNYLISLKDAKEESNIIFLAFILLNKTSERRVSKIWPSLSSQSGPFHPIVEPYHPNDLTLVVDGIWLNEGKTSFLVLRINSRSLPTHPDIKILENEAEYQQSSKRSNYIKKHYHPITDFEHIPIISDFDPGYQQGVAYISSEVGIIGEIPRIERTINKYNTDKCSHDNETTEPSSLSSGDTRHDQDNKNTAKTKNKKIDDHTGLNFLDKIYNLLVQLKKEETIFKYKGKEVQIEKLICYDHQGNEYSGLKFAKLPFRLKKENKINTWIYIENGELRSILLCKIKFDMNLSFFILEIERRSNDSFRGLLFKSSEVNIKETDLYNLLKIVAQKRGKLKYRATDTSDKNKKILKDINYPSFIKNTYAFEHGTIGNSMSSKIKRIINTALNNIGNSNTDDEELSEGNRALHKQKGN